MRKKIDYDEPAFRVRHEAKGDYWVQYDVLNKSWFRLCHECIKKVCNSSESLCSFHYNKQAKMKKKLKRLNTKCDTKTEQTVNEEINESLGIVISVSSNLTKKQISQVKEFITKFHNKPQSIQFTCESQPDYIDDTTTHLIANDSGSFTTILTKQIIQACVRHIFIGSLNWIISSIEQSIILDHFPFEILRDKKSLKNSRGIKQCRFDHLPVFPSSSVISIECPLGIKSLKISRDELIEIIELSGATLFNEYTQYKTLFILCNTKKEMLNKKKQNDDNLLLINDKILYYCKPEFLFDSIVRHEIQSIERYLW